MFSYLGRLSRLAPHEWMGFDASLPASAACSYSGMVASVPEVYSWTFKGAIESDGANNDIKTYRDVKTIPRYFRDSAIDREVSTTWPTWDLQGETRVRLETLFPALVGTWPGFAPSDSSLAGLELSFLLRLPSLRFQFMHSSMQQCQGRPQRYLRPRRTQYLSVRVNRRLAADIDQDQDWREAKHRQ